MSQSICSTHRTSADSDIARQSSDSRSTTEITSLAVPALQTLTSWSDAAGINLRVLRLDLIDPWISGNKWYKLHLNLIEAREQGHSRLLSFGGAWSNHLYALAAAAARFSFETIGVVRGEIVEPLNPVLRFTREQGMVLRPCARSLYREQPADFIEALRREYGDFFLIPEGGGNLAGVRGCAELATALPDAGERTVIALACGTGTTLAGLIAGFSDRAPERQPQLLGVPVLKGGEYLHAEISKWLSALSVQRQPQWHLETAFHCGGYARTTPDLLASIARHQAQTGLPLEPVYTGKLFHALEQLAVAGRFARGSELVVVHTGGIIAEGVEKFPTQGYAGAC